MTSIRQTSLATLLLVSMVALTACNTVQGAKTGVKADAAMMKEKAIEVKDVVVEKASLVKDKTVQGAAVVQDKSIQGAAEIKTQTVEGAAKVTETVKQGAATATEKVKEGAAVVVDKTVEAGKAAGAAVGTGLEKAGEKIKKVSE